ncbi:hypothetical protein GRI40_07210 [Altererythrobacter aerius]|uniref:Uncharacterized protein n=1 Tax=Tsuneonella aeria TaxID=1837929 RepID=A0A6I4TEC1_9SPHN|nr:hypothetical protein [Tsuneonella aeria]MXO75007.1 hypothetical protein [Tsuneonella aeria]
MSFLKRLFGVKPDRRSAKQTGFFWQRAELPALAAGRGFNQDVVGESFHKAILKRITGGSTRFGVTVDKTAELVIGAFEGSPALFVFIEGQRVGSISRLESGELMAELLAVAPNGHATSKANVGAGYEGADYCVRLSLARPLRVRSA